MGYRRIPVIVGRIGHLASEIDCFLKLQELERKGGAGSLSHKYFILAPKGKVANVCLLSYWRGFVRVVETPWHCFVLDVLTAAVFMRHDINHYILAIGQSAAYATVNNRWGTRAPLLKLKENHRIEGQEVLRNLGVPDDAWFVCVHARSGAFSPEDESVQGYRNVSIESMIPAMQEIVRLGGWCIRLPDGSGTVLPHLFGIIDYANHELQTPATDIFLAAKCRFFLGNTSGLFLVSTAFGAPCALTNMVPVTSWGFSGRDLCIFKLMRKRSDGEMLSIKEMFQRELTEIRSSVVFEERGVEVLQNDPEDVVALVKEMFDRLSNFPGFDDKPSRLQKTIWKMLNPGDYCYGTACRVSSRFLEKHQQILGLQ